VARCRAGSNPGTKQKSLSAILREVLPRTKEFWYRFYDLCPFRTKQGVEFMRPKSFLVILIISGSLAPVTIFGEPILPKGLDPQLDNAIKKHEKQFYTFNAYPFGLSLNCHFKDMDARAIVQNFLDSPSALDFRSFSGVHQHNLLSSYGEYGDLGFFGGVALAGTAFRYMALKKEGASKEELERAREAVVRAAKAWHVFYVVTGGNGVVARGIVRLVPENPNDPPIPGVSSLVPVPLFDENGNPLPMPKDNGSFRADNSKGALPEGVWGWYDSASKDQLTGQVLGLVALFDALYNDPDVDQGIVKTLQEDALGVARMLMQKRDISQLEGCVGQGEYDLIIMDADGRPTKHHDLNPSSIEKFYAPKDSPMFNVFNLFLSIGILKGLYHVTGDEALGDYIYQELFIERGFLEKARNFRSPDAVNYIYMGKSTNTDNVDMTAVGLFLTLYTEKDEKIAEVFHNFLENGWWNPDYEPRFCASKSKQPLWHALYLAVSKTGPHTDVRDELVRLLKGFPLGSYWQDERINCDEEEIKQGECIAIDGKTKIKLYGQDPGGAWLAEEALDPQVRPNSDFNARSNPFHVNGYGEPTRLNPGGDLLAAYWISRALELKPFGQWNVSKNARQYKKLEVSEDSFISEEVESADFVESVDTRIDASEVGDTSSIGQQTNSKQSGGCIASGSVAPSGASVFLILLWFLMVLGKKKFFKKIT
jgi:hypothetical protein